MIIRDTSQIRKHVPAANTFSFGDFKIYERRAAQRLLEPTIGKKAWQAFLKRAENNILTDLDKKVLPYIEELLSRYAMYLAVPEKAVQMTDSGLAQVNNEQLKAAYKYQTENFLASLAEASFEALESILQHFEEHYKAPEYIDWRNSRQCTQLKNSWLRHTEEFLEFIELPFPRYDFQRMKRYIKEFTDTRIKPTLRPSLFAELEKSLFHGVTPKDVYLPIFPLVRECLANYAYAKLLSQKTYHQNLNHIGLSFPEAQGADKEQFTQGWLKMVSKPYQDAAEAYEEELRVYLMENRKKMPRFDNDLKKECVKQNAYFKSSNSGKTSLL